MNTFKRRYAALIGVAFAALFLSACGGDQAFVKAQADAITAQSNARVEEAKAAAEQAKAVQALSAKIDAGGASAYLVATALKGMTGAGSAPAPQAVQRPRDWFDYLQGGVQMFASVANAVSPIAVALDAGKTNRRVSDNSVLLEGQRQGGETARFASATGSLERLGIAGATADRGAHTTTTTTITAGGDVANNGSSIARITCQATGGNWTPTVPPATGTTTTTTPPAPAGSAGAGTCTQR